MSLTLVVRLLGFEVLHLELAHADAAEDVSLDGGTTVAYPVGFSAPSPPPAELDCPQRIAEE